MKKLILLSVILFTLSACSKDENKSNNIELSNTQHYGWQYAYPAEFKNYKVITIDSCEYIMYATHNSYLNITHKGNCKNSIHKCN
jgi:hypothetical protein